MADEVVKRVRTMSSLDEEAAALRERREQLGAVQAYFEVKRVGWVRTPMGRVPADARADVDEFRARLGPSDGESAVVDTILGFELHHRLPQDAGPFAEAEIVLPAKRLFQGGGAYSAEHRFQLSARAEQVERRRRHEDARARDAAMRSALQGLPLRRLLVIESDPDHQFRLAFVTDADGEWWPAESATAAIYDDSVGYSPLTGTGPWLFESGGRLRQRLVRFLA